VTPAAHPGEHLALHGLARRVPVDSRVEQALVAGEAVADVGHHRELDGVIEVAVGTRERPHTLGAASAGVPRDALCLAGRGRGEALPHPLGEAFDEEIRSGLAGLVT